MKGKMERKKREEERHRNESRKGQRKEVKMEGKGEENLG